MWNNMERILGSLSHKISRKDKGTVMKNKDENKMFKHLFKKIWPYLSYKNPDPLTYCGVQNIRRSELVSEKKLENSSLKLLNRLKRTVTTGLGGRRVFPLSLSAHKRKANYWPNAAHNHRDTYQSLYCLSLKHNWKIKEDTLLQEREWPNK